MSEFDTALSDIAVASRSMTPGEKVRHRRSGTGFVNDNLIAPRSAVGSKSLFFSSREGKTK